jgi:fatty-acid desaturase
MDPTIPAESTSALYWLACALAFVLAYLANILTISVLYHRDLAHGAVRISPRLRRLWIAAGPWITGLDPKAWSVMHRRHHAYSDTPDDPHSPVNVGIAGILREQLRSYERVIVGLHRGEAAYTRHADGLDFPLSLRRHAGAWVLPYLLQGAIATALALTFGWALGVCYFVGMMSHPLQGGLVNAFGHAVGGRNFDTPDASRNNTIVAWLVLGEGYQNNHHAYPASARFSAARHEVDLGFGACLLLERAGALAIRRDLLIPPLPARQAEPEPVA